MAADGKKKADVAFKEYVERMIDGKKFRPDDKSENRWHVESEDAGGSTYTTTVSGKSAFCTCSGFRVSTGTECKHARLIRIISGLCGFAPTRETIIGENDAVRCPACRKGDFRKHSLRPTTRKGDVQKYTCNACGRAFSEAPEFGPTWYSSDVILRSIDMYCRGMSTRQIRDHWRDTRRSEDEKYPSHAAVSLWVKRYLSMIAEYMARFTPDVSDIWSTDEMYILVKKMTRYLYTFMDHGTRWLLSAGMADEKGTSNITPLARDAKRAAGKIPEVALRDGGANLNKAIRIAHKEKGADGRKRETQQVYAHLTGNPTNRRQERVNRTLAERLRIPGFLKSSSSRLIAGYVAFYNCIRRHMGLGGGRTPARAAGIIIKGANPWATLIRNAYWQG